MDFQFLTCDVFTDRRFGGNPLAVFPHASGLTDEQMLAITREFNYSETTFVLPAEAGNTRRVRIFTPGGEVPFAGHPNVGTACALIHAGLLNDTLADPTLHQQTLRFEELAGVVPVEVTRGDDGGIFAELTAPESLSCGEAIPRHVIATALSITEKDIVTANHEPRSASVGLPIVMVEVADADTLARVKADTTGFNTVQRLGISPLLHVYCHSSGDFDLRTRMFAPMHGVPEDPATGSANCALAGMLAQLDSAPEGEYCYRIAQGIEMGRPSALVARVTKHDGKTQTIRIGGQSVMVMQGSITV